MSSCYQVWTDIYNGKFSVKTKHHWCSFQHYLKMAQHKESQLQQLQHYITILYNLLSNNLLIPNLLLTRSISKWVNSLFRPLAAVAAIMLLRQNQQEKNDYFVFFFSNFLICFVALTYYVNFLSTRLI